MEEVNIQGITMLAVQKRQPLLWGAAITDQQKCAVVHHHHTPLYTLRTLPEEP